jgi:hypothetical protein
MKFEKLIRKINDERNAKLTESENYFGDDIKDFENKDWSKSELMAYDLGYIEALQLILKLSKEIE